MVKFLSKLYHFVHITETNISKQETLRLYPAVYVYPPNSYHFDADRLDFRPFDVRRTINATTLPDSTGGKPWYVPPDTE